MQEIYLHLDFFDRLEKILLQPFSYIINDFIDNFWRFKPIVPTISNVLH